MKYRWVLRPAPDQSQVEGLSRLLNDLHPALTSALLLRGISTFDQAKSYFRTSLDQLNDPFLMKGMSQAVERIMKAREHNEPILVYGDYDVDGTTSTALMSHFLRSIGISASYWIPHRIENGYGLCNAGIDVAAERGAGLIIALDCGITALAETAYAKEQGIDMIICDHHTPGDEVPDAVAVLDPKQKDCTYPFEELSGCGVGFKLIQATMDRLGVPAEHAVEYLDLVAISTASDIVPLEGENRVLMIEGLKQLSKSSRPGIRSLAKVARIDLAHVESGNIVFGIGPRINAAGRLEAAEHAVDLLLASDRVESDAIAERLDQANSRRREMDREVFAAAAQQAERQISDERLHCLVVHDESWHPGIVGIVASRLVDRFYRPAVVLSTVNGQVKGSARSIYGVNVYDALHACSDVLVKFGGHDYAAGLSLDEDRLQEFRERFNEAVGAMITPDILTPVIEADARLNLNDVDNRFWKVLRQFAPFGPSNKEPVFLAEDLVLPRPPERMGRDGTHIKFWVRQQDQGRKTFEVVGFGMHEYLDTLHQSRKERIPLKLLFTLSENRWNGSRSLQLKARDLQLQKSTIC